MTGKIAFEGKHLCGREDECQLALVEGDLEIGILSAGEKWPEGYARLIVSYDGNGEEDATLIHDEVHATMFGALAQMHLCLVSEYEG